MKFTNLQLKEYLTVQLKIDNIVAIIDVATPMFESELEIKYIQDTKGLTTIKHVRISYLDKYLG